MVRESDYAKHSRIVLSDNELNEFLKAGESSKAALQKDPHGRFRSWEHCYGFFSANRFNPDEETIDLLCLHLAFYLASWGMYRGSSFLFQKDYLFHRQAVQLLLSHEWSDLWHPSATFLSQSKNAQRIMDLSAKLNQIYMQAAERERDLTDTLTTKILLGTLGCVPAYDINFKKAARKLSRGLATYTATSVLTLARFYSEHEDAFEPLRLSCNQYGVDYPPMKILDMCLFTYGQQLAERGEKG